MKSLHVAVIVKNTPTSFARDKKGMGQFSYAVDEFTWDYISPPKYSELDVLALKHKGYDCVIHEDSEPLTYKRKVIPVIYYSIDSTLSIQDHYHPRHAQARQADLILVDHDRLERFYFPHIPTRRLLYCVNDRLFKPQDQRDIDINYHCGGSSNRVAIRGQLDQLCKDKQWKYVSGVVDLYTYAAALGRSRIVVNVPRNEINRPHRVYDSLASGCCLVSLKFPMAIEEGFKDGVHFVECHENDLPAMIEWVFEWGRYEQVAKWGYEYVMGRHTWAVRAKELRAIIEEEFGI